MANIFICGRDGKSAFPNLRRIWDEGARFTVDILGEAVVSDREADEFAARYRELLDFSGRRYALLESGARWLPSEPPFVNVSVKISALCARVQATDPKPVSTTIMERLKRIADHGPKAGSIRSTSIWSTTG